MLSFLRQREKISLSFADEGVKKDLEADMNKVAVSKISRFWKHHGTTSHILDGLDRQKFIRDKENVFPEFYAIMGVKNGWGSCQPCPDATFRIPRLLDVVSLLKVTAKNVWKISLFVNDTQLPIYTKRRDDISTFCVELPFPIPLYLVPYTEFFIIVHGEDVKNVKVKGGFLRSEYRNAETGKELFHGRFVIANGTASFSPEREE